MFDRKDKWKWIAGGAAAFVLLFVWALIHVPFEITVAPQWTVRVVDENGQPVPLAVVREEWKHDAFDEVVHQQDVLTTEDGTASFPKRSIRASLLDRNSGCRKYLRSKDAVPPCGIKTRVFAFKCGYGAGRGSEHEAPYSGDVDSLETKLVLRRCATASPGFGCSPHPVYGTPRCP